MKEFLVLLLFIAGVVVLVVINFTGLGYAGVVVLGRGNFSDRLLAEYLGEGNSVVVVNVVFNDTLFVKGARYVELFGVNSTGVAGIVLSGVRGFVFEGFESVVLPHGWVTGLVIYNSSNSVVGHVVIRGSNIVIANSRNITLEDCVVVNSTFPVVIVKNSSDVIIRRCLFSNSYAGLLVENSRNVRVYYNNVSVSRYLLRAYNSEVLFYGNNVLGSTLTSKLNSNVTLCVNGVGNYYGKTGNKYPCTSSRPFRVSLTSFTSPLDVRDKVMIARFVGNIVGIVLLAVPIVLYVYRRLSPSR